MKLNTVIEIKSFKPALSLSEETLAFTGKLYIDGKPVAELSNRGHGDPVNYSPLSADGKTLLDDLKKTVSSLPPVPIEYLPEHPLEVSLDWFLAELAQETVNRNKARRDVASKSWVRFAKHQYKGDEWHVYRVKWTPELRAKLEAAQGPIVETRNEQVAAEGPLTIRKIAAKMDVPLEALAKL